MTKPTKLTDTQSIILAAAYARDDMSLCPLPDAITDDADKAVASLLRRKLAVRTCEALTITNAGIETIGGEPTSTPVETSTSDVAKDGQSGWTPREGSKSAHVVALLKRAEGATLDDLVSATGWLPHTTRAALTGLRKRGLMVAREQRDNTSIYRIAAAA